MSRQAHERKHHRWTSQILHEIEAQLHQVLTGLIGTRVMFKVQGTDPQAPSDRGIGGARQDPASGPHQRSRAAALSGSHPKAPGSAGGYLLDQAGTMVKPGRQAIVDIDDTFCAAHGGQQLAFWNAHHDERGFNVASATPVVAILRPACTPKGAEVRTVVSM
jgi:hypothetical protein